MESMLVAVSGVMLGVVVICGVIALVGIYRCLTRGR
jgi:hypothetical protein